MQTVKDAIDELRALRVSSREHRTGATVAIHILERYSLGTQLVGVHDAESLARLGTNGQPTWESEYQGERLTVRFR